MQVMYFNYFYTCTGRAYHSSPTTQVADSDTLKHVSTYSIYQFISSLDLYSGNALKALGRSLYNLDKGVS